MRSEWWMAAGATFVAGLGMLAAAVVLLVYVIPEAQPVAYFAPPKPPVFIDGIQLEGEYRVWCGLAPPPKLNSTTDDSGVGQSNRWAK